MSAHSSVLARIVALGRAANKVPGLSHHLVHAMATQAARQHLLALWSPPAEPRFCKRMNGRRCVTERLDYWAE